jgi:hypothetical protein
LLAQPLQFKLKEHLTYLEQTEENISIPIQELTLRESESVSLKREQERDAKKETGPLFIGLAILRMEEKSLTQDQKALDIQRLSHLEQTMYLNVGNLHSQK